MMLCLVLCGYRGSSLNMDSLLTDPSLSLPHHYLFTCPIEDGVDAPSLLGLQSQAPTLTALQTYLTLWEYH